MHTSNDGVYSTRFNEKGEEVARLAMGNRLGREAILYSQPDKAIPIVFLPGIMGTPLIAIDGDSPISEMNNKWAWFPDSITWMAGVKLKVGPPKLEAYITTGFRTLTPKQRSLMLKPGKTRVPLPDEADLMGLSQLNSQNENDTLSEEECRKRGWGSVLLGSNGYGEFLRYLDAVLNNVHYQGQVTPQWKDRAVQINNMLKNENIPDLINQSCEKDKDFTLDDAEHLGNWYFPVYAAGYNWLESNDTSAKEIADRIKDVLSDCQNRLGLKCNKVIIVTHSMGGLVARMCAKKYSDNILGVIHGVQPINGAATAYHRVVAGWDFSKGVGFIFGTAPSALIPIFVNKGPLELLPNKNYGKGWFNVNRVSGVWDKKEENLLSLPKLNPYAEIYRDTKSWWRLITPEKIMPESSDIDKAMALYLSNVSSSEVFHDELNSFFHDQTYIHYGQSESQKTWFNISFNVNLLMSSKVDHANREDILNGKLLRDYGYANNASYIEAKNGAVVAVKIKKRDGRGDGTVPADSMHLTLGNGVRSITVIDNIVHGASYDHDLCRLATLYGICEIVGGCGDT